MSDISRTPKEKASSRAILRTARLDDLTDGAWRVLSVARSFLRWWRAELKGMLPEGLVRMLEPPSTRLVVQDMGESFEVSLQRPDGSEFRAPDIAWGDIQTAESSGLAATLAEAPTSPIRLVLAPERTFSSDISLPKMSGVDREKAARLRYDSELPLNRAAAYYTHRLLEEGESVDRIRLYALRRSEIDRIVSALVERGLSPAEVTFRDEEADGDIFLPGAGVSQSVRMAIGERLVAWGPVLVLLAALGVYLLRLDLAEARIDREVAAASADLKGLAQLTDAYDRDRQLARFLHQRLARTPLVQIIDGISGALPDEAWVTSLRLSGPTVQLTGLAPDPSSLVAPLEANEIFQDVRLATVSTNRAQGDKRRFEIFADRAPDGGME